MLRGGKIFMYWRSFKNPEKCFFFKIKKKCKTIPKCVFVQHGCVGQGRSCPRSLSGR